MKVVYIAGKYRAATPWQVRQNIEAAARVAAQVWKAGAVALCPHMNSAHMEGVASDEHFLAGTMELLERSDAIVMLEGWQDSEDARAEHARALARGIPIMYEADALIGKQVRWFVLREEE